MPALINKKTFDIIGKAQKIESEINVSDSIKLGDSLPNLKEIIFSSSSVSITDKSIYLDTYTVRGQLKVTAVYTSEDEQLESVTAFIPFEAIGELPEGDNKNLFVSAEASKLSVAPLRQRRIDIEASIELTGYSSSTETVSESLSIEGIDDIYTDTVGACAGSVKSISSSREYEFEFDPGKIAPGKIICASGKLINPATTGGRSAVLYNALMKTEIVYSCEEEDGSLSYRVFSDTFPVNQVINTQAGDEYDDFAVNADISLDNAAFVFGEGGIKVQLHAVGYFDLLLTKKKSWQMISDVYSPYKNIAPQRIEKSIAVLTHSPRQTVSVSDNISVSGEANFGRVACTEHRISYSVQTEEGSSKIEGTLSVEALILGEKNTEVRTAVIKIPFSRSFDNTDGAEEAVPNVTLNALNCELSGDRLYVGADIDIYFTWIKSMEIKEIEDISVSEYEDSDENYTVIKVHYFRSGERLWDIAKANRSSVSKILSDNSLECEEDVKADQALMITS